MSDMSAPISFVPKTLISFVPEFSYESSSFGAKAPFFFIFFEKFKIKSSS